MEVLQAVEAMMVTEAEREEREAAEKETQAGEEMKAAGEEMEAAGEEMEAAGKETQAGEEMNRRAARLIQCPSVHFLGDHDFLKEHGTELLDSFVDPLVIRHPKGHTIPRFDDKGLESMLGFLEKMQKDVEDLKQEISLENDLIEL